MFTFGNVFSVSIILQKSQKAAVSFDDSAAFLYMYGISLENFISFFFHRERPLLQGVPSPKPIHGIGFGFTLCGALKRYAGLRPAPHQRRCLWTPPKGHRPFGIPILVRLSTLSCVKLSSFTEYLSQSYHIVNVNNAV